MSFRAWKWRDIARAIKQAFFNVVLGQAQLPESHFPFPSVAAGSYHQTHSIYITHKLINKKLLKLVGSWPQILKSSWGAVGKQKKAKFCGVFKQAKPPSKAKNIHIYIPQIHGNTTVVSLGPLSTTNKITCFFIFHFLEGGGLNLPFSPVFCLVIAFFLQFLNNVILNVSWDIISHCATCKNWDNF
jgi:hypothetical protein